MPALLLLGRALFVAGTLFFAWWSLRGRWDEVGSAVAATPWWALPVALALVVLGLLATSRVWLLAMGGYGHRLATLPGSGVFFVGQLGKYLPGSVWSLGIQARMARAHGVPVRTTLAAGLVFLGYHVATGVVLGGAVVLTGGVQVAMPDWLVALGVLGAALGMSPLVVDRLGRRVGGTAFGVGALETALVVGWMLVAWLAYGVALAVLLPDPSGAALVALVGAFALAYAVGVVVVLAPAGVGAREATLVALVAPVTGFAAATSVALLARVLHTAADFAVAAVLWSRERSAVSGPDPHDDDPGGRAQR